MIASNCQKQKVTRRGRKWDCWLEPGPEAINFQVTIANMPSVRDVFACWGVCEVEGDRASVRGL